ncbi:MAG TPA: tetratricopeptide repeat protein [Candidatus Polarisedimenticolia bacterium]|nr:tetratricopeptide repeat protein [Candidatus Polarisedimenticolia bacterium]
MTPPHWIALAGKAVLLALAMAMASGPGTPAHEGLDEQLREATRRIERAPGDASLRLARGELHRARGSWALARADYAEAARLDPRMEAVDLCLGLLHVQSGEPARAVAALDRFLARRPGHADALIGRARARAALDDAAGALSDYDAGIAAYADPARPQPEHYLERAGLAAKRGDIPRALRGLDEGLARLGNPVTLQMMAIDLESARGAVHAALARVDAILAAAGRKERWLKRRGEILERAGRRAEARAAYEDALAALATLPAGRRGSDAARRLEEELRQAARRLEDAPAQGAPAEGTR